MSKPTIPVPKGCHLLGKGRTFLPPSKSFGAYVLYDGYESWMWEDHTSGNGRDHWYAIKVVDVASKDDVVSTQPGLITRPVEDASRIIAEAKALAGIKEPEKAPEPLVTAPEDHRVSVFTRPMPTPCDQSSCEIDHFLTRPLDAIT